MVYNPLILNELFYLKIWNTRVLFLSLLFNKTLRYDKGNKSNKERSYP
jgi:hypothetical protein